MSSLELAGGRIKCRQCDAKSKRTHERCKAPAMKGKTKCATHGGKSSGPKSAAGKARCAQAKTTHGRESRSARESSSRKGAELSALEDFSFKKGIMIGTRSRGRKSKHYPQAQQQLLAEIDQLLHTPA